MATCSVCGITLPAYYIDEADGNTDNLVCDLDMKTSAYDRPITS